MNLKQFSLLDILYSWGDYSIQSVSITFFIDTDIVKSKIAGNILIYLKTHIEAGIRPG